MTSWKLMAAAIKAQRTWANLSPEQKAEVGKAAQKAAVGAYARLNQQKQPAQAAPAASDASAQPAGAPPVAASAPGATQADTPRADPPPPVEGQAAEGATPPPRERSDTASTAAAAAANAVEMARAHGPRLARQAASSAATHSRNKASQLYDMWRRSQGPEPK